MEKILNRRIIPVAFLVLSFFGFYYLYKVYEEPIASSSWPTIYGRIVSNRVIEDGDQFKPLATYTFTLQSAIYHNSAIGFIPQKFSTEKTAQDYLKNHYPVGKQVLIHYAPHDPAKAILEAGMPNRFWLLLFFPTALLGLSAWLLFWQIRQKRRA